MADGPSDREMDTSPNVGRRSMLARLVHRIARLPVEARGLAHSIASRAISGPADIGRLGKYVASYAIATAAGALFIVANLPLPWLLGPLTIGIILSAAGRPLAQPNSVVLPLRSLLGVAIGSSFAPALIAKAPATALSLILMIPYTVLITFLGTVFLERLARFDRATAFFSAAPGGLADMVIFARDAQADLRRVTLVQAARVLAIVFVLPFWLQFVGGLPLGGAMPKALHIWQLPIGDAVLIVAIAWAGWRAAEKLGLFGGSIVGPMVLSAILHVLALTTVKVPVEVLIVTQISIGIVIGGQFKGISLREFVTILSWGFAFAFLLVIAAAAMTLLMARLTGLDATALLLSYAPGGQNEMAVMALILGLDVAIVALHHLLRVMMVIVGAQIVFKQHGWKRREPPGHGGRSHR
jgi:membrane AbrB-like protein